MTKKKPIKLKRGYVQILAAVCKVSRNTVTKAMKWNADSDIENFIRKKAYELDYVRKF